MANLQPSNSKRFSEAWYKEIESILKKEFATQTLSKPKSVPRFVITDPEDETQMRDIREFFANRVKLNHQIMEDIVGHQLDVTEKLLEKLFLSDLDKRKIQELQADLDQTRRINSDYSAKNDALNKEITSLMARIETFGKVSRDETPKLNRERRHQSKNLLDRFNDSTLSDLETSTWIGGGSATEMESLSPGATVVAKYDNGVGVCTRRSRASSTALPEKKIVTELARTFQVSQSRRSKNGGNASRVI